MNINIATILDTDLSKFCSLAGLGELTPEEVQVHAPDALISLDVAGSLAARASLWWSRVPQLPNERIGLIGHYAVKDARSAEAVLSAACTELGRNGCSLAVGPMDGSTWRRYRLLTGRGDERPFFLEPDNPDEWPKHFESSGFSPLASYVSSLNEDIRRPLASAHVPAGFTIRPLNVDDIVAELHRIYLMATKAFAATFLYTPIDESESRAMYLRLLPVVRPELVLIAELDAEPVGFCFAIPDLLQARRGMPVDTYIMKTIAVLPEHGRHGLGTMLIARANEKAARLGMRRGIHALMHENNPSRKIGRGLLRDFRRYTLFARRL